MGRFDFVRGSSTVSEFFGLINERHEIWLRRRFQEFPWTDDPVLRNYQFCNVFRELDRGTLFLRKMWKDLRDDGLRAWTAFWYRRTGHRHLEKLIERTPRNPEELHRTLRDISNRGHRIFTDAYMNSGRLGEDKLTSVLNSAVEFWCERELWIDEIRGGTLENAFRRLRDRKFWGIGAFMAYEIVTDMRWTDTLREADDRLTWANIGPGAKRGMQRLGKGPTVKTMRDLFNDAPRYLSEQMLQHYPIHGRETQWPPFELREIEHCLCEFDKYCRIKEGNGRTMRRYRS